MLARLKLALILRSKSTALPQVSIGDLVDVFVKQDVQKRGKWLLVRSVLDIDRNMGTVKVPGLHGSQMAIAVEYIRPSLQPDTFVASLQEANDLLDETIGDAVNDIDNVSSFLDHDNEHDQPLNVDLTASVTTDEPVFAKTGDRIEVYWPLDDMFYPGVVDYVQDTRAAIKYDDGDEGSLDLRHEPWRFASSPVAEALTAVLPLLASSAQQDIGQYMSCFGNKSFLHHQAQGLAQHALQSAHNVEEEIFKKHVEVVPRSNISHDVSFIRSHVVYKVKLEDDGLFMMKARIAPHRNGDSIKEYLRTDCASCAPTEISIVLSVCTIRK